MSSAPKLSIGVPVYNGEKYMRRALDSVLTQSFRDLELIISDNASTDATPAISAEYARNDPRVRVVRHDRTMTAYLNFRHVYREAAGEYFMWLACDDWWRDGFLEQAVGILDADPGVTLVFSHIEFYNWATEQFGPRRYVTSSFNGRKTRLMTRILNTNPHLFYGMFRKSALDPEEILAMDFNEVYFADLLAIRGDTSIVNDHLFVSGEKVPERLSWSVHGGNRLRYFPYWRAARRMIRQNFRGPTRWLFLAFVLERMWRWKRHL